MLLLLLLPCWVFLNLLVLGDGISLPVTLDCGEDGGTIASVDFASFGIPGGSCGASPSTAPAMPAVRSPSSCVSCLGQQSCALATDPASSPFSERNAAVPPWVGRLPQGPGPLQQRRGGA